MLLNYSVGEDLESPLDCKEIKPVNPKGNQSWIFIGRTDAEAETPILWPTDVKSWLIWKTLMLGKIEGGRRRGSRGWDGWLASPTQWTWVWARSRSWWWTGKPGVLQSMGSQSVGHNWATELNWIPPWESPFGEKKKSVEHNSVPSDIINLLPNTITWQTSNCRVTFTHRQLFL